MSGACAIAFENEQRADPLNTAPTHGVSLPSTTMVAQALQPVRADAARGADASDDARSTDHAARSRETRVDTFESRNKATPPGASKHRNDAASSTQAQRASESRRQSATTERSAAGEPLTEEQQQLVEQLRDRDREVRQHEQAHKAAGGAYAGAISYSYQRGPDGQRYAVGGQVPIDASAVDGDPQATIAKMQVVRRAALAPAEPSSQDRRVAAEASQKLQQAQTELARQELDDKQVNAEARDQASTSSTNAQRAAGSPSERQGERADAELGSLIDIAA